MIDQEVVANEWVVFRGEVEEAEDKYYLKTPPTSGSFKIAKDDVRITVDGTVELRKGASVYPVTVPVHPEPSEPNHMHAFGDPTPGCGFSIPPTGKPEKAQKAAPNGTTCYGVVLVCHYCNYGANGIYTGDSSEVCGACIGFPF